MDDQNFFSKKESVLAVQQQQQQDVSNKTNEVKSLFKIGSKFSFPLQITTSCIYERTLSIKVAKLTTLIIDTIAIDPLSNNNSTEPLSLFVNIGSASTPTFNCICPHLSSDQSIGQSLITNLNFSVNGPQHVRFALVSLNRNASSNNSNHNHEQRASNENRFVNMFGRVEPNDNGYSNPTLCNHHIYTLETLLGGNNEKVSSIREDDVILSTKTKTKKVGFKDYEDNEKQDKKETENNTEKQNAKSKLNESEKNEKKRKLNEEIITEVEKVKPNEIQKLTKKQRRKLAKEKEKELREVISKQNGHDLTTKLKEKVQSPASENKSKKISLTKERLLPGGVLVRDIIHGMGSTVKSGRKVSINYIGRFADTDKEFDKNASKSHPLVFRLGTGEVIRGLDKGLEGMKVGGERVITIPPELGYGRKGSGKIPGDCTLCFEVKLLSVGTK